MEKLRREDKQIKLMIKLLKVDKVFKKMISIKVDDFLAVT